MSFDPSTPARAARVGLIQISVAGALWGTGGLAVQLIREIAPVPVLTLSAYRMVIAAATLGVAILLTRGGSRLRTLVAQQPLTTVAVGAGTAAYQALYFGAVVTAGVTVATVIALGLAPVLLTISDANTSRRGVAPFQILVLVVALTGLILVSGFAGASGPHPRAGILLAIASGTTYAATTAGGLALAQHTDPLTLATATTMTGALVLLPCVALQGSGGTVLPTDPAIVAGLAYLGVFTMAVAYALLYAGLRTTSGSVAAIATLVEPVTAATTSAIVLGERLGAAGIIGTVLILAAVAGLGQTSTDPVPEEN